MSIGQHFARFVTVAVVRRPWLWRLLRPLLRRQFDTLAPVWDARRTAEAFATLAPALERLDAPPDRVLDLGTGTGSVARILAERFPAAEIVGVDLSPRMIDEARARTDAPNVRYEIADAQRLAFDNGAFDLVVLANMIPFFDELARVVAPGGHVLFSFSMGAGTPIYVAPERLRDELGRRGFAEFAEVSAGAGTALTARKR
ncbi:MAG: class I SAM-dependent methyltransferase [Gaiellaceae bacterium]